MRSESPIAHKYKYLESKIDKSAIRGGYGLAEDTIPEFEEKAEVVLRNAKPTIAIDGKVIEQIEKKKTEGGIENLFNAMSFRDFVMKGYGSLCAITKTVIRHDGYMNLEAAHIKPKSHGGFFLPNNGIAMCRDMHWAFDKGFFTLTDKYEIEVHRNTSSDWLWSYNSAKILIPEEPFFQPAICNIKYHRENVYGLFLTSGRL
jgi:predicted restriction endonuclease